MFELLAQTEPSDFVAWMREFGFEGAMAIVLFLMFASVFSIGGGFIMWLGYKYVPLMVDSFRDYMHTTAQCAHENKECNLRLVETTDTIRLAVIGKAEASKSTNAALVHLCQAAKAAHEEDGPAKAALTRALPHIDKAIQELSK